MSLNQAGVHHGSHPRCWRPPKLGWSWVSLQNAPALGEGLPAEQSTQIMANHRRVLASLLKQKTSDRGVHEPVLIPLGMVGNECRHGAMEVFRHLIFHTHVNRNRIRRLAQLKPLAVNVSIRP